MFARDLHGLLAWLSLVAMAVVTIEGAVRVGRATPPGAFALRSAEIAVIAILLAAAGGLALLIGGRQPRELLHLVYALLVFAALPVADALLARASPRPRAAARLGAGLVGLVLVARLFATG